MVCSWIGIGVGDQMFGSGGLAGVLRPQAIGFFAEGAYGRRNWPDLGVCSNGRFGSSRRPSRRSTRERLGSLTHHDCRAAEQSEQSEDDRGALYARAPVPPTIIKRQQLKGWGTGFCQARNASQEVGSGAAGT
jgi:hypothetical protein